MAAEAALWGLDGPEVYSRARMATGIATTIGFVLSLLLSIFESCSLTKVVWSQLALSGHAPDTLAWLLFPEAIANSPGPRGCPRNGPRAEDRL